MFVLTRLFKFHRRCGMSRRHALRRALAAVLRDLNLTMAHYHDTKDFVLACCIVAGCFAFIAFAAWVSR